MFRVGQKVVCVDADGLQSDRSIFSSLPQVGSVYTVREIIPSDCGWPRVPALTLNEIKGEWDPMWGVEYSFLATRFRPIVDRTTDISVFKEMLHPSKIAEACDV